MRTVWYSWGVGLCALVLACAPPPVSREGWRASEGPEALLARSIEPLSGLEDLTAEAAIELRQGKVRERGTALIQLVNPQLFRIEVRGPFFTHIFTALLEGDSLTVYGRAVDTPLKGAAHGHLLAALTGLDLGQFDLRYALLGLVEPGSVIGPVEYPRADRAVVSLGGGRRVWLDMHRGFARRETVTLPGGDSLRRELKEYQRTGSLYLPRRVEIRQRDVSLTLEYKSYAFNRGLDAEQLQRGIPQNAVRVP
jgi:outer membrane lipoprotein-sorting protein